MKLSIITINYNNAVGLRKTLASVASQTYRDIEHIIVDGGSTDGSVDVIREYENTIKQSVTIDKPTIHVTWISEKDNGIYNAMNKGIEIALGRRVVNSFNRSELVEDKNKGIRKATGDYVWILNSGDCAASPDVVERMINTINSLNVHSLNNKIGTPILLGNIVKLFPNGKKLRERKMRHASTPKPLAVSMLTFYRGTVPQDAAFVRRDLFEKYGLFDDSLKICADWKLYLNIMAMNDVVPMYVDIDVVLFDMTGISNANVERRNAEKRAYLEEILPASVLKDYDAYAFPIEQYKRLHKHHLWRLVYFLERVLFKLEKWHVLNK